MKRFLSVLFSSICVVASLVMFTACAGEEDPGTMYLVQFYNQDGSLISEQNVASGQAAQCPTVEKASDKFNVYEFANWEFSDGTDATLELASVTKDLAVRAKFNSVRPTYTINFYYEDGTTLFATKEVLRGDDLVFPATAPTKEPGEYYDYSFDVWKNAGGQAVTSINSVSSNQNLYASFVISNQHTFLVNFYDDDGVTLLGSANVLKSQSAELVAPQDVMRDMQDNRFAYLLDYWTDVDGVAISTENIQKNTDFYAKYGKNIIEKSTEVVYTLSENELYYTVSSAGENVTEIEIQASFNSIPVTTIKERAFYGLGNLGSINIPNNVTTIGANAFQGCSLVNVIIPDSVTDVGNGAFMGCALLESVKLPSNLTKLQTSTFSNCSKLTSIEIPTKVKEIGSNAFVGCTSLSSITIPASVTQIGQYAFYNCTGLETVTLSEGLVYIKDGAFQNCSKITNIHIPSTLEQISADAFKGCDNLAEVVIDSETISSIANSYSNIGYLVRNAKTVYVVTEFVLHYKVGEYIINQFGTTETITEGGYSGYTKYSRA